MYVGLLAPKAALLGTGKVVLSLCESFDENYTRTFAATPIKSLYLQFEYTFPGGNSKELTENYRSIELLAR